MKRVSLDQVRHIVSSMMNEENDAHAEIISDLNRRIDSSKYDISDTLEKLTLIHESKIKVLEELYNKLKDLK